MTQSQSDIQARFPYGIYEVPDYEHLRSRYADESPSLARCVPLPTHLPRRHPVLEQLVGRFPVHDALPPWWHSCVHALIEVCPCLQPVLCTLSLTEFRQGTIDQQRWRMWRTQLCQQQSQYTCQQTAEDSAEGQRGSCWQHLGPGLHRILDAVLPPSERKQTWLDQFVSRGHKNLPEDLDLVITADPAWWLNMSNGYGWYTCMGSGDDRDPQIIGNWYDTGVLLAALVERGADCWTPESLIARTILRLVEERLARTARTPQLEGEFLTSLVYRLVMGRVYHNDRTAATTLLAHLARLCAARGLSWGASMGRMPSPMCRAT